MYNFIIVLVVSQWYFFMRFFKLLYIDVFLKISTQLSPSYIFSIVYSYKFREINNLFFYNANPQL